jgi:FKBP-type peptidyl-prolyl cis-trans isomerase
MRFPTVRTLLLASFVAASCAFTACSGEAKKDPAPANTPTDPTAPAPVDVKTPKVDADMQQPVVDTSSDDPKDYPKLRIEVGKPGEGKELVKGKQAKLYYTGTLLNGREFDSSFRHGADPAVFNLNGVVKGFRVGLLGMKVGERRRLTIPGEIGYGQSGNPGAGIGPNETLIFDVELVDVID